jgi:hypothetical protein
LNDAHKRWYESFKEGADNRPNSINIYLPTRTAVVFCAYENVANKNMDIPELPEVTDR